VSFDPPFDLDAYLLRVGLPARVTVDAAGLERLQRAHRQSIPFENLDVMLNRRIAIDTASVFAKLVAARRGGYCFEHGRLFADALAALGFRARPLLARVVLGLDANAPAPPLTHTLSLVTLDDGRDGGEEWIADAGFGGAYTPPMKLEHGAEAASPDGARHRLERTGGGWLLLRDGHPATGDGREDREGWRPQYTFRTDPVEPADLDLANFWVSTAPASRFRQARIVSIVLPTGFASLNDRQYRRRAGQEEAAGTITDPRVYRMRLSLMFGIDLTADEAALLFPEG
jgi:N-hydroxyarylamine O-acetyltransferase